MIINTRRKKTKGFLLAEAMFSIFVTILVISILQNLLLSMKTANRQQKTNDLAYAYVQLDRFLHDDAPAYPILEKSNSERTVFYKKIKEKGKIRKKQYAIEHYDSMIRMTTLSAGHMPLLLHVEKADFLTKPGRIVINIHEEDGRFSQLVFRLEKEPTDEKS